MTIVEFLLARIAEDEADARTIQECDYYHGVESDAEAEVQRLSDPGRVLAECEAKRRIVDNATNMHTSGPDWNEACCILAAVYADHPDYREEWRP